MSAGGASSRAPAVQVLSGALEDGRRRESVYAGDLLIFKDVESMLDLCTLTADLARNALGVSDPPKAQFELERGDYLGRIDALQKEYRKHPEARKLLLAAFEEVGVDLRWCCWDWLHLRVLSHGEGEADRRVGRLKVHRDTWASNVYAQTNWWAPIYPITPGRTIAFYPSYWSQPVRNTSGDWDLEKIRAERRGESRTRMPLVPEPTEPVDPAPELRVTVEPGDMLCFSGAHLHAGTPNTTGVARFSIEARTVDARDVADNRGAPNVDGAAPHVAADWFRHVAENTPLSAFSVKEGG